MSRSLRVDAVVSGAGAGGLCAAARLARGGLRTILVDERERVGGRERGGVFTRRSCDLLRATGIDGLLCVGDSVKVHGNGCTQACVQKAKLVGDAILASASRPAASIRNPAVS